MATKNRREAQATSVQEAEAANGADRTRDAVDLRRHRQLLELAPVGYLATDASGVIVGVYGSAAELLERPGEDLVGSSVTALVGAERRALLERLIADAVGGAEWHDEVPFLAADGGRVRLLVHAARSRDPGAREILWSLWEPTRRALRPQSDLADAQRVQRQRLSTLLDRLQHGVMAVDESMHVSYANSAAGAMFDGVGSLVGSTLSDPWPEPSLQTLTAQVFEHLAEPAEARVELRDGRIYEVLVLPPDASGEALIVIGDVSGRERRQRAEREFVANAAHQLRTPVSAIASAIEVLQGGAKENPETRDRFLAHLDRQCTRLVRLTRALLLLARAQALAEPPAVEVVMLRPLLEGIARALRPGQGVDVRLECPFTLAALTNRDLLEQAIGNVAENAAKYTVEGEIVLCAEPDGRIVRVVVSDTGPGADLSAEGSFPRFYRDPAAEGEGFGLGLAIAAEAVRALRGELEIESGDEGTRVVVTLPAATVRQS